MAWTSEVLGLNIQEIKLLKTLREQHNKNSWQKIANDLNVIIKNEYKKTGRQCREKYLSTYKFEKDGKQWNVWSREEERKLFQLYWEQGSSWTNFEIQFSNKQNFKQFRPINCIKNKFNCKIKKVARDLLKFQKVDLKNTRSPVTFSTIISFLDLCSYLKSWMIENNYKVNYQSKVFFSCHEILKRAFIEDYQWNIQQTKEIVANLKYLNFKLKSLGLFKTEVKKNWKLSEKSFQFIKRADNVALNQEELQNLVEENQAHGISMDYTESFMNSRYDELMVLDIEEQHKFLSAKSYDIEFFTEYQAIVNGKALESFSSEWETAY